MSETGSVVVTGGSSGIGLACVERLLAEGRPVYTLDRVARPPLDGETQIITDLSDSGAIEAAFDRIADEGAITGLVNNAGISQNKTLAETTGDDFTHLSAVNMVAPALCAKRAAEAMRRAGWGRIVNISSRVILGKEKRTAYAATKGGLAAMTKVWALELAASGITVNTVAPGPIATDLFRRVNPDEDPKTQKIIDGVPVKRLGTPQDIAHAVMFFLGRESGFVTGQTLYACGGMTVGQAP